MTTIDYAGWKNIYTYEGWQKITNTDSKQYKLRKEAYDQGVAQFDNEGFAKIRNYFVIACAPFYGGVGTYIDWTLADGTILHTIVGDLKNVDDKPDGNGFLGYVDASPTCKGHGYDPKSIVLVEFVVDCNSWYNAAWTAGNHVNPGTSTFKPEWAGQIQSYEVVGNWWGENPDVPGGTEDQPAKPVNPNNPKDFPKIDGTKSAVMITGYKFSNGAIRFTTWLGSQEADGFVYWNDDNFYRANRRSPLQVLQTQRNTWVYSNIITELNIQEFDVNGLVTMLFGGTSYTVPTVQVKPGEPGSTNPAGKGVEAAIQWAISIANDDSHGYDQGIRWGPDYDCSSLVYEAFRVGGGFSLLPVHSGWTGDMVENFTKAGFNWLKGLGNDGTQLQRGDILLYHLGIKGHAAIYLGNGQIVSAHSNEFGKTKGGQTGDQTGHEIDISNYYSGPWQGILRYSRPLV